MIGVLLVDDHISFRQPLAFILEREPDITVVGEASTLAEARGMLSGADVAIVDLGLPNGNGVALIRALRAAHPDGLALLLRASPSAMSLILSDSTDHQVITHAIAAGTAGVLHKSADVGVIVDSVRRLGAGEPLLSTREIVALLEVAGRQRAQDSDAHKALGRLTPREREVLNVLAEGLNDKEIAQRLHIGTETARTHMVNILRKLEVDSRLQALVFAVRYGAVTIR